MHSTEEKIHKPVLLEEALKYLDPQPGDRIIDATLGAGGHTLEILKRIGPGGQLLSIEVNKKLYEMSKVKCQRSNVSLVNDNFRNLEHIIENYKFGNADGILFDLGVSSWHLEGSGRGFSFLKDEPLDMRLGENELTARDIVNQFNKEKLTDIFKEYGEERFSRRIAEAIVEKREKKAIETSRQLAELIEESVPGWYRHRGRHPATKIFQALRIAVNDELGSLRIALDQTMKILNPGGRLVVISFHSLEDRIVKRFMRSGKEDGTLEVLTKKPIVPGEDEVKSNPRSRSAKLRAARKTAF